MFKVGITGGIGSGKTTVCQLFNSLFQIPVFYADQAAKFLQDNDDDLKKSIISIFGQHIYKDGRLNRPSLASIVFNDSKKLEQLNHLVHPAVAAYFEKWMQTQTAPYILKEAAIFFESGSDQFMDLMIGVFAPVELRINRVVQRDSVSAEVVMSRISQQMDEDEKMKRCHFVILNDGKNALEAQIETIHKEILKIIDSKT